MDNRKVVIRPSYYAQSLTLRFNTMHRHSSWPIICGFAYNYHYISLLEKPREMHQDNDPLREGIGTVTSTNLNYFTTEMSCSNYLCCRHPF